MGKLMDEENAQDRVLRALQVASVSGFLKRSLNMQVACLSLCNGCRRGVPVQRLKISSRGPPALLSMLCPDMQHPKADTVSRVEPPRRVLRVEIRDCRWIPRYGRLFESTEVIDAYLETIPHLRVDDVRWPPGTKEICLPYDSGSIDRVVWPEGLEVLSFCPSVYTHIESFFARHEVFNSPLDGLRFPSALREIFLGIRFNQSIEGVSWPEGLERLSLPGFDQSIQGVRWPAGLKSLEFMPHSEILLRKSPRLREELTFKGFGFNQELSSALPASLETLWLSDCFDRSLDGVVLPRGLVSLGVGSRFPSTYFSGVSWPSGLRNVYTVNGIEGGHALPRGCLVVALMTMYD